MAGKTIGRNTNVNDGSDVTAPVTISTISSLSNTISAIASPANNVRIYLSISNEGPGVIFVKLQAASVDNTLKGDLVQSGQTWWMTPDNIYTGEVSTIAKTGSSPDVHVTEY